MECFFKSVSNAIIFNPLTPMSDHEVTSDQYFEMQTLAPVLKHQISSSRSNGDFLNLVGSGE